MTKYGQSFAKYYDLMYSWKDYAKESEKLLSIIARHGNGKKRLLEVACGTGKYVEHFKDRFVVTGIDLSEDMLQVAKGKLPGIRFMQGDMLEFKLEERFDVLLCLFSSIAYANDDAELRKVMKNFYDHLEAGGIAIIEPFIDPDKCIDNYPFAINIDRPEIKLSRHNVARIKNRKVLMEMHTLVTTPAGVEYFVEDHDMTLFEPSRMIEIIKETGFAFERIESGLMKDRSLFVCKKL